MNLWFILRDSFFLELALFYLFDFMLWACVILAFPKFWFVTIWQFVNSFWRISINFIISNRNNGNRSKILTKSIVTNTFHKACKCNYCGKLFNYVGYMRRHIKLFLFMKVAKISNVNLVENHLLKLISWVDP